MGYETGNVGKKNIRLCALGAVLLAAALCYTQISGRTLLVTGCLFAFLLFTLWAGGKGLTMHVLLFFLPWSTLLKTHSGGISFFTLALLGACVIACVKSRFSFEVHQTACALIVAVFTLIAKLIQDNPLENSYFFFLILLFLFPLIEKGGGDPMMFRGLTLFFAIGIISAALTAQRFAGSPNISQYIKVDSYLNITRLCGYYGDPNFYSAHITACLTGIMILLSKEKEIRWQLLLAVLAVVLVYCGLISGSKAFVLVVLCMLGIWITTLLDRRSLGTNKMQLILGIVCILGVVLFSSVFSEPLQVLEARFSNSSSVSAFTTKRTDIWMSYLREFARNPLLLLFGEGYTNVNLNRIASHNTLIQGIYQFGILGFLPVCIWMFYQIKNRLRGVRGYKKVIKFIIIVCIGVGMPWMSLDILFFDELFLLPVYAVLGIKYSANVVLDRSMS